jgi:hypothetical protein
VQVEIPKNGDLLRRIQVKMELPAIEINYNNTLDVEIQNIKKKYSYKSINLNTYNYNLYNLNTLKQIMDYQLENTTNVTNYPVYLYDVNTKKETYNVIIPSIDLNQFIEPSSTEYYFVISPDNFIFSNSNISFNYPLIDKPLIENNYNKFLNKTLLYSNRNNKLSASFNIINNLFNTNDTTTLLTSNNIKNMVFKKIKDNMFFYNELAPLYSIQTYINSIRFIRPIPLYDDSVIKGKMA